MNQEHTHVGGCLAPAPLQNRNLKNTDHADIVVLKMLCGLPFSRNEPLKAADD